MRRGRGAVDHGVVRSTGNATDPSSYLTSANYFPEEGLPDESLNHYLNAPALPGAGAPAIAVDLRKEHHLKVLLAVALSSAVLYALAERKLRVPQDHNNPTLFGSQFDNKVAYWLTHSAVLRGAIVAETGKRVAEVLEGPFGYLAAVGVREGLKGLNQLVTDPRSYSPVGLKAMLTPKMRTELSNTSRLVGNRWAKQYAQQLGRGLGEASADGMLVSLAEVQRSTLPARLLERVLYSAAGLPRGQALSVVQVAQNRIKTYMGTRRPIRPADVAADLGKILLSQRSKRVLYNENTVVQNFGTQIVLMNALSRGYLAPDARKVWVTAVDERVCPVCAPMDSVAVKIEDAFLIRSHRGLLSHDTKLWVPPAHTNCRCTIVPESAIGHGIITRTARFTRPEPRARLRSRMADIVEQSETPPWYQDESGADQTGSGG